MLANGRRLRIIAFLIAAIVVIADSASAQQKVGESDGFGGFDNAFYTVKLSGPAAFARGGTGVATQTGAAGFLANPANLSLNGRLELFSDAVFSREKINYRPSDSPYFVSGLSHNSSLFNSAAAAIRAGRFTAGLALSMPREFENDLHMTLNVVTYEGEVGAEDDSLFYAVKQWQLSAGLATNLLESLRFGFAAHLLKYQFRFQEYWRDFFNSDFNLSQNVLLFQIGLRQSIGDLRLGASLKSPEDSELQSSGNTDLGTFKFPFRIPAEFSAGIVYADLISGEFKILLLDDSYYEQDMIQLGGGLHLPLYRVIKLHNCYANIGVVHRSNPEYFGEDTDQTFLNTGFELELGQFEVSANYANGSVIKNSKASLSELAIGLRFHVD